MLNPKQFNNTSADLQLKLSHVWQLKGNLERAFIGYQEVLSLYPDYIPAYIHLGNLRVKEGRIDEALEYYDQALALDPEAVDLSYYYAYFGIIDKNTQEFLPKEESEEIPENPVGKINLYHQKTFPFHRSGWNFAINALKPLHNSQGILFDGFLENAFCWQHQQEGFRPARILEKMKQDGLFSQLATSEERGITPYYQPWVGFLHNPPEMPVWFNNQDSPQKILAKEIWKKSINSCVGLFALSEYQAQWLREQTGKPVSTLIHPTEISETQFDFDKFINNSQKKIVQIGWWLRKLNAIYQLPLAQNNPLNYEKIKLTPIFFERASEYLQNLTKKERNVTQLEIEDKFFQNTKEIQHLANQDYDKLLSENIAFVDLYDSSANNAVIECIARATPLLINPLPAVVEYLGQDYPMYFSNLSEAAAKALDTSLILDTHEYLKHCETRKKLSAEYFLKSFEESEVYQLI